MCTLKCDLWSVRLEKIDFNEVQESFEGFVPFFMLVSNIFDMFSRYTQDDDLIFWIHSSDFLDIAFVTQ